MGGTTFYTTAKGKTAQAAFDSAYQDAKFEYGHGGYSGSIAEKSGYVELPAIPGVSAEDLGGFLANWNPDEPMPEPTRMVTYTRTVRMRTTETQQVAIPASQKPPAEPTRTWRGNYDTHNAEITSATKWKVKLGPISEWEQRQADTAKKLAKVPNLRRYWQVYDEKWGPALCIRTGDDEFAFMGWAST